MLTDQQWEWDPPEVMVPRNRRIIAERLGDPPGSVEECERVEAENPGWHVWWAPENTAKGFECPAGYHALLQRRESPRRVRVFGETVDDLIEAIRQ